MTSTADRGGRTAARVGALLLAAITGVGAAAQTAPVPGLPPEPQVVQVLGALPAYAAALRELRAAESVGMQTALGANEWTVSASAGTRRQRDLPAAASGEWEVGLDRPLRWPGKGSRHERLGQAQLQRAQAARDLVWREQTRALLDAWSAWWREQEAVGVLQQQEALQREQLAATARRRALGAAAALEQQQAEAAAVQLRAQLDAALARRALAAAHVERRYGGITLPAEARLPDPEPPSDVAVARPDQLRAASVERALATAEAELSLAQAATEAAERRPDPTVGLRYGRAGGGAERSVGIVLSMPIGGAYRAAAATAADHRAQAAAQRLLDAEWAAERAAEVATSQAASAHTQWRLQARAADQLGGAAQAVARAYALGEGQMSEVLAARRLAAEQLLAARQSAVEAWTARLRLLLEAGQLWAPRP